MGYFSGSHPGGQDSIKGSHDKSEGFSVTVL